MRVPILTYHAMRIDGNGYGECDLAALASDLRLVTRLGFRIVALSPLVRRWLEDRSLAGEERIVALTCDDGSDFDFHDLPHPVAGTQRSVLNILRDFQEELPGAQPELNITSFVVASPDARAELDRTCMIGRGWWTQTWWASAAETGLMHIGNHSWDHHHDTLPPAFDLGVRRGTFATIDNRSLADREIRRAAEYLARAVPNPGTALFAYPYGEANRYLTTEYFPAYGRELGIHAAFTDRPGFLTRETHEWEIPRFMFGRDWTRPSQLEGILEQAKAAP